MNTAVPHLEEQLAAVTARLEALEIQLNEQSSAFKFNTSVEGEGEDANGPSSVQQPERSEVAESVQCVPWREEAVSEAEKDTSVDISVLSPAYPARFNVRNKAFNSLMHLILALRFPPSHALFNRVRHASSIADAAKIVSENSSEWTVFVDEKEEEAAVLDGLRALLDDVRNFNVRRALESSDAFLCIQVCTSFVELNERWGCQPLESVDTSSYFQNRLGHLLVNLRLELQGGIRAEPGACSGRPVEQRVGAANASEDVSHNVLVPLWSRHEDNSMVLLSPTAPAPFNLANLAWKSVEHYLQAFRFAEAASRNRIRRCASAEEARLLADQLAAEGAALYLEAGEDPHAVPNDEETQKVDTDSLKERLALRALKAMFADVRNVKAKEVLESTGEGKLLVDYDDRILGYGKRGKNIYGKLLMALRTEYRGGPPAIEGMRQSLSQNMYPDTLDSDSVPVPLTESSFGVHERFPLGSIFFCSEHRPFFEFLNAFPCDLRVGPHNIRLRNKSVEHFYQSKKFPKHERAVVQLPTARHVLVFTRTQQSDVDRRKWESKRDNVMLEALRGKFDQRSDLLSLLLSTGDRTLVFDSAVDGYWGVGADGLGWNRLGRLLMQVRSERRLGATGLQTIEAGPQAIGRFYKHLKTLPRGSKVAVLTYQEAAVPLTNGELCALGEIRQLLAGICSPSCPHVSAATLHRLKSEAFTTTIAFVGRSSEAIQTDGLFSDLTRRSMALQLALEDTYWIDESQSVADGMKILQDEFRCELEFVRVDVVTASAALAARSWLMTSSAYRVVVVKPGSVRGVTDPGALQAWADLLATAGESVNVKSGQFIFGPPALASHSASSLVHKALQSKNRGLLRDLLPSGVLSWLKQDLSLPERDILINDQVKSSSLLGVHMQPLKCGPLFLETPSMDMSIVKTADNRQVIQSTDLESFVSRIERLRAKISQRHLDEILDEVLPTWRSLWENHLRDVRVFILGLVERGQGNAAWTPPSSLMSAWVDMLMSMLSILPLHARSYVLYLIRLLLLDDACNKSAAARIAGFLQQNLFEVPEGGPILNTQPELMLSMTRVAVNLFSTRTGVAALLLNRSASVSYRNQIINYALACMKSPSAKLQHAGSKLAHNIAAEMSDCDQVAASDLAAAIVVLLQPISLTAAEHYRCRTGTPLDDNSQSIALLALGHALVASPQAISRVKQSHFDPKPYQRPDSPTRVWSAGKEVSRLIKDSPRRALFSPKKAGQKYFLPGDAPIQMENDGVFLSGSLAPVQTLHEFEPLYDLSKNDSVSSQLIAQWSESHKSCQEYVLTYREYLKNVLRSRTPGKDRPKADRQPPIVSSADSTEWMESLCALIRQLSGEHLIWPLDLLSILVLDVRFLVSFDRVWFLGQCLSDAIPQCSTQDAALRSVSRVVLNLCTAQTGKQVLLTCEASAESSFPVRTRMTMLASQLLESQHYSNWLAGAALSLNFVLASSDFCQEDDFSETGTCSVQPLVMALERRVSMVEPNAVLGDDRALFWSLVALGRCIKSAAVSSVISSVARELALPYADVFDEVARPLYQKLGHAYETIFDLPSGDWSVVLRVELHEPVKAAGRSIRIRHLSSLEIIARFSDSSSVPVRTVAKEAARILGTFNTRSPVRELFGND